MALPETKTKIKPDVNIKEPPNYRVIYLNDDKTSMEFVIGSLMQHFSYPQQQAVEKTEEVHEHGSSTVAVLPYEMAEQKGIEVTLDARAEGFPLQVKIEPAER